MFVPQLVGQPAVVPSIEISVGGLLPLPASGQGLEGELLLDAPLAGELRNLEQLAGGPAGERITVVA